MPQISLGPSEAQPYLIATVAATNQTVTPVAAVTAQIVKVYAVVLVPSTASTVTFTDSATSFSFGGLALAANSVFKLDPFGCPWFVTAPGASFQITNTVATLTGWVYYTQNKFQA